MSSSSEYLRDLTVKLGYSFRFNEVTDRVEVNGVPMTDALAAEIRMKMRDEGHKRVSEFEDAYTAYAWANRYHPIRDYISSLTYDGQPHIAKLASHFADKHDIFGTFLRRWLIGAVAKVYEKAQNFMLVLDGPQDIGKSFFAAWLCPQGLRDYRNEGGVETNDKDTWLRLVSTWLWEVSELGATTRKADREALKDFISRIDVTVRRPYGRFDVTKPALASLIGTINDEGPGFLNDPTGSRRFAVVELKEIDHGYTAIDLSQVWAEAYTAYQAGESWRLTTAERRVQTDINANYEVESGVNGFLRKYYKLDPTGDGWTSGIDIVQELEVMGLKSNQHGALMELARLMKNAGIERRRINGVWSYRGITRKTGSIL